MTLFVSLMHNNNNNNIEKKIQCSCFSIKSNNHKISSESVLDYYYYYFILCERDELMIFDNISFCFVVRCQSVVVCRYLRTSVRTRSVS